MVIIEAPFVEELPGMAMVKILDIKEQTTNMIKLKFVRNKAVLKVTNKTQESVTFGKAKMMGIIGLRSLGFFKIKQEVLHEKLRQTLSFRVSRQCMQSIQQVCKSYEKRGRKFRR